MQNLSFLRVVIMSTTLRSIYFTIFSYGYVIHLVLAQVRNQFTYNGFHQANLSRQGIAVIHPNGLLQLTNTSKQQIGRAFYPFPLVFNTSSSTTSQQPLSFSTSFVFAMVPELQTLSGHGIAFLISQSMDFSQAVASQYLGLFNSSNNGLSTDHVLAIEFDPILNPEFEDINNNHVGIDVNSLISLKSAPATYLDNKEGKNKSVKLISGEAIQVWIDYEEAEMLLNVTIAPIKSTKPDTPLLSSFVNLSVIFNDSMYVGFSAATGSMASDHYILGWSFNKSGKAQSLDISNLPTLPLRRKASRKPGHVDIILLVLVVVVLITLAIGGYLYRRKKFEEVLEEWEREYIVRRFSYKSLYKATKGFKDKELLGTGGFGKVYRGILRSNVQIAVKKVSHNSKQGIKEFVAEIASMGRLRHRNLVQLLGYCRRRGELLLVYDYMPNGSLDKCLFSNDKPVLTWFQRFHILRGIASALLYLHEEWDQVVLHRDIKASNVLLDANLNGRLGDFGLARLYDRDTNPQTTHLVGTIGYLAPELTRTGKATTCTDVFAFGAFMLEVACGRRPIDMQIQHEECVLVEWIVDCWKRGVLVDVSDPKLKGYYVGEEMELVLKLGLLCSDSSPAARPTMRRVMQYLDGNASLPETTPETAEVGISTRSNEVSDFGLSFPSSLGNGSFDSMS